MAAAPASAAQRAARLARRAWPYVMMAWERWQALPPEQRERYLRQARGYAERGRTALEDARSRRRRRRG
jgi:hypothetical protein